MWKPDAVVPEHRWRARIVWASLLVAITAYTIWQIWKILDELANPSTSLKITNDLYAYPYVEVCFFHQEGCGFADGSTDYCRQSALFEGFSTVYFGEDFDSFDDLVVESQWSNCVGFDLGRLEFGDDVTAENDQAVIDMWWYASDIASTETDYYDHIAIYMSEEAPTESTLSFLYVPYSRIEASVGEIVMKHTELTIGKTTKKDLSGDVTTTFPALVLSSSDYTTENPLTTTADDDFFDDIAYGRLYLDMKQGSYSRTAIEEVDPLDIGTFLGNIGGFWELLLILWGLFFIATREEREPKMKARDFGKTVQTTKEIVTRRRSLSVDAAPSTTSGVEQRPQWESAFGGDNPIHSNAAAAAPAPSRSGKSAFPPEAFVNESVGSTATRRASSTSSRNGSTSNGHQRRATSGSSDPHGNSSSSKHRRPVAHDMPRRGSRSGGKGPERQRRAPPSYDDMSAV